MKTSRRVIYSPRTNFNYNFYKDKRSGGIVVEEHTTFLGIYPNIKYNEDLEGDYLIELALKLKKPNFL